MTETMVVDASVVAKWFLDDEEGAAEALAILLACLAGDLELRAPPVMHIEVCNLLTKACGRRDPITKSPRLTKERAIDCIDRLFLLPIQILPGIQADAAEALAMAVDYSKTYLRHDLSTPGREIGLCVLHGGCEAAGGESSGLPS